MRAEYRIVKDCYMGFEVQWRRWWWPFWTMPRINTHKSVADAEQWAITRASAGSLEKYLGRLP